MGATFILNLMAVIRLDKKVDGQKKTPGDR
jgi:hypothetical protein